MKIKIILSLLITVLFYATSLSQVKVDVETKVKREANQRANSRTDQAIDKGFDKLEEGIGKLFKKKNKKKDNSQQEEKVQQNNASDQSADLAEEKPSAPDVKWAKYDFVPGDEVIFEDTPSADEESGEFPSRWDLYKGSAEIGEMDDEPVIIFLNGGGSIVPYVKNATEDYLPEIFTIEFDVWFEKGRSPSNRYFIHFRDHKNQWNKGLGEKLTVNPTGLEFANTDKRYPGTESLGWSEEPTGKWRHISIAYTKGKFKAYMDDTRLINVPHLEGNPWGITIRALAEKLYLKNIRIAEGGVKYYDRVLSDGKIIVNGIRFDVNKSTIKPESNGAINEIFNLMNKQSDLNFSVEGHTDSDGDETLNQSLSETRAKAVKERLISMGISSSRLKSTGWGESKPIGENGTAEGKANNRRVEFVKF
ncbi:MAG: OmpA family protein [Prolixibacteraceae bacterium]|jgi:OmpA-OmpF porin, OOP family|nr:OmpA family protein [Prolixibacteraceae bacterium]MBT6005891.1 OmpA family protein [Prolixibacteraceae bacterium]MBT6763436.1 OmpA family protein [Prolixibacteraceae bacterium]MBT6996902.1 OmpA family protein [Prolixibacteraceae bacterium]MBT7393769.1 OmpA family protein [Prolixibacteraceae bacterium]